jgi:hypothetical protein
MIYFLVVVAVGGTTTITGPLLASLLLGVADVAGKYYVPKLGAFIIYCVMIIVLIVRAAGTVLARRGRVMARTDDASPCAAVVRAAPERAVGVALWTLALLRCSCSRGRRAVERNRDPRAVRAVPRPDPRLRRHRVAGPRGVPGTGCYAAALFAKHVYQRSRHGPVRRWRCRGSWGSSPARWCCAAPISRA